MFAFIARTSKIAMFIRGHLVKAALKLPRAQQMNVILF
jgi:hypothetical protein